MCGPAHVCAGSAQPLPAQHVWDRWVQGRLRPSGTCCRQLLAHAQRPPAPSQGARCPARSEWCRAAGHLISRGFNPSGVAGPRDICRSGVWAWRMAGSTSVSGLRGGPGQGIWRGPGDSVARRPHRPWAAQQLVGDPNTQQTPHPTRCFGGKRRADGACVKMCIRPEPCAQLVGVQADEAAKENGAARQPRRGVRSGRDGRHRYRHRAHCSQICGSQTVAGSRVWVRRLRGGECARPGA